jgi:mRNA interferase HigB
MRIISRKILRIFWTKHADAEVPIRAWFAHTSRATWRTMTEIKADFATASIIDNERVVFNIGGNKYRLVVKVWFPGRAVWVKFVGTHRRYDKIDVTKL